MPFILPTRSRAAFADCRQSAFLHWRLYDSPVLWVYDLMSLRRDVIPSNLLVFVRLDQLDVAYTQSLGKFEQRDHRGIPPAPLKTAEVLLAEPGASFDFLLRQALRPTQTGEVPTDQLAHIHAERVAGYTL
jgi:hypothetical protein